MFRRNIDFPAQMQPLANTAREISNALVDIHDEALGAWEQEYEAQKHVPPYDLKRAMLPGLANLAKWFVEAIHELRVQIQGRWVRAREQNDQEVMDYLESVESDLGKIVSAGVTRFDAAKRIPDDESAHDAIINLVTYLNGSSMRIHIAARRVARGLEPIPEE